MIKASVFENKPLHGVMFDGTEINWSGELQINYEDCLKELKIYIYIN